MGGIEVLDRGLARILQHQAVLIDICGEKQLKQIDGKNDNED